MKCFTLDGLQGSVPLLSDTDIWCAQCVPNQGQCYSFGVQVDTLLHWYAPPSLPP